MHISVLNQEVLEGVRPEDLIRYILTKRKRVVASTTPHGSCFVPLRGVEPTRRGKKALPDGRTDGMRTTAQCQTEDGLRDGTSGGDAKLLVLCGPEG